MIVLLADDDGISRVAMKDILRAEPSWQLMEAGDGEAAWDMLDSGLQPDLCLLDIRMPRLNGGELLERMRSDPRFRDTRVIIISSVRTREVIVSLVKLGVLGYLLKPYTTTKVLSTIRRAFGVNVAHALTNPFNVIRRLRMTPGRYMELLAKLLAELDKGLLHIREAALNDDTSTIALRLQTMASAALTLGAEQFERVAMEMAQTVRTTDGILGTLIKLEEELQKLHVAHAELANELVLSGRAVMTASSPGQPSLPI